MEVHLETMMERLNSGEQNMIFKNFLCFVIIGLTKSGRAAWQEKKDTKKHCCADFQEQFCTSELSKVIQDAILLVYHYRTMSSFQMFSSKNIFHVGCAINLHFTINSGWIPGGQKFEQTNSFFCQWILWTKNTRILPR